MLEAVLLFYRIKNEFDKQQTQERKETLAVK